jgi:glutamate---cysteine ligase / carboxylate-amine ligase
VTLAEDVTVVRAWRPAERWLFGRPSGTARPGPRILPLVTTTPHDDYFAAVEPRFADGDDLTVGIEEEFQILDPATLALTDGFEVLSADPPADLRGHILGELISCEVEVATLRCPDLRAAAGDIALRRAALFEHAAGLGFALGAMGTHPFSLWRDQHIIDTPHYRLVEEGLRYVAWRNNTWSFHVHVGVRGLDRAVRVCDLVRQYLPHLLALSANSPFIEGVWTHLHSARTQTFTRMFPRCGVPDAFGSWAAHRSFYEELLDTNCLREFTQVWWSVRPHHKYGTVEIRICDAQTELWQTLAIASLMVGLVAAAMRVLDQDDAVVPLPTRYIEENLWRAIRHGLDGKLVDWERHVEVPAADAIRRLVDEVAPLADEAGFAGWLGDVERLLDEGNGAQRQERAHRGGESLEDVFAETVRRAAADAAALPRSPAAPPGTTTTGGDAT